jgi:hypothetical protein
MKTFANTARETFHLAAFALLTLALVAVATPDASAQTAAEKLRQAQGAQSAQGNPPAHARAGGAQNRQVQGLDVAVQAVRVAVTDLGTGRELGELDFGDTLLLETGQRVRLRVIAEPAARNRARRYPSATFEVLSGSRRISMIDVDEVEGSAVVEGVRSEDPARPDSTTLIEIELMAAPELRDRMRKGTLTVEVTDDRTAVGSGNLTYTPTTPTTPTTPPAGQLDPNEARAQRVVDGLYHAILLRPAEPAALEERSDDVQRLGMQGITQIAREIALSAESRTGVYDRGVDNGRRVQSLYEHLLGLDLDDISVTQYREDVRRVEAGQLADLVVEMVSSGEFQQRYQILGPTRRPMRRQ